MARVKVKVGEKIIPMDVPDDWSREQIETAIHKQFPDEGNQTNEQLSSGNKPIQNISDAFKKQAEQVGYGALKSGLEQAISSMLPENFRKGAASGLASSGLRSASGIQQLMESQRKGLQQEPYSIPVEPSSNSIGEMLGRGYGTVIGSVAPAAPAFMASEAALPASIPALLRGSLAAGLSGASTKEGTATERGKAGLIDALVGLGIGGIGKGIKNIKPLVEKSPDLEGKIKELQNFENKSKANIGDELNKIANEAEERGIKEIPLDADILKNAEQYLPKTKAYKLLLDKAKTGDYQSLRKLQSDLRTRAEKQLGSQELSQQDLGREMLEVRENINDAIENHFIGSKNPDLAERLNTAREQYKELQKTYFSNNELAKLFGREEEIPSNLYNMLTKNKNSMAAFREAHPELNEMLSSILKQKEAQKTFKKYGLTGLGLGSLYGLGSAGKSLYNLIKD